MKTYALVMDGIVQSIEPEFVSVGGVEYPLADRLHPDVVKNCIELRGGQITNVQPGYLYDGEKFSAPGSASVGVTEPPPPEVTKESLQAEVTRLSAEIAALVDKVEAL